jgi:uncharacterized membrane protein YjjP (DUF1212 family)
VTGPERPSGEARAREFVLKLGQGLHAYGYPAHRLEEALVQVCGRLGLDGQFFSLPTALFAAFGQGEAHRTFQIRVEPGGVDLGKLARLDELRAQVAQGRLSPEEGARRVGEVLGAPDAYGPALTTAAFALASSTACRFFGGGLREIAAAGVIGFVIGLLAVLLARRPATARLFEALAAAVAGFLAVGAEILVPPLAPSVATLAGLIVLVPGYGLTVAFAEIATRHLVSGTARLAGAGLSFLVIAFGVALGTRAAGRLFGATGPAAVVPLPEWTLLAALLIAPWAFAVLFRVEGRDVPWVVAATLVAFAGGRAGVALLGPELGAFLGATAVSAFGNAYNRAVHRPAPIPIVPGLLLLVPGSLGFQSLAALMGHDTLAGIEAGFRMALVAVSLATGLLVANVLLPPVPLEPAPPRG